MPPRTSVPTTLQVPLDSSCLRSVGYSVDAAAMEVTFRNGSLYRYFDVPEFLHGGFMVARSKGASFNTRIDARFRHEEVR